jgi:multicomponent Na+:H+ antiporter subunit D
VVAAVLDEHAIGAVAVAVSFYTLMSMVKIWNAGFWGEQAVAVAGGSSDHVPDRGGTGTVIAGPAVALAIVSVVLGVGAEWLYDLCRTAGELLADKSVYVDAVLGR